MTDTAPETRPAPAINPSIFAFSIVYGGMVCIAGVLANKQVALGPLAVEAGIFAFLVGTDTYRTAQAVDEILVKTHSSDVEKVETIIGLVDEAFDMDALLERI